ncbi:MAG TPA: twin-arginine translocase subunit TatB [Phycisphaerales bacterium]|nr:twin-arginine translocase subunit TatB [Phycisphaerales bacterium]
MFNIGGSEMVVLGILALLVFGPEGLPGVIKTVMRTVHAFRQAAADFQHEVKTALDDENIRRDQLQRQRKPPADEAESATDQENQQAPNPQQDSESLVRESDDRAAEFPVMVENEATIQESVAEQVPEPSEPAPVQASPATDEPVPEDNAVSATEEKNASPVDPSPAEDDDDGPSLPMATRKRTE